MSRYRSLLLILLTISCSGALFSQVPVPATEPTAPGGTEKAALTPEQIREQRIRAADPLDKTDPVEDTSVPASGKPLPGSVAASSRRQSVSNRNAGPTVLADDASALPTDQYSGPAVLSRSYTINRPAAAQSIRWTPTLSAASLYETGLTGSQVGPGGVLSNTSSPGARLGWGINGQHLWKHDRISVDYMGDANRYSSASGYNGTNHRLNVGLQHAFNRHLFLNLDETASSYTQSYTLSNPALGMEGSIANVNLAASPTVQVLDNGFKQTSTSLSLTWQKSARLSFNMGGGYFGVVRNSPGFFGNTGYTSTADVNYRYTRKTTVGAYYAFSDFVFSHRVQVANTHTVGLIYSYAFSRSLEARVRVGGTQLESQGLMSVAIPAEIAALLGQNSGIVEAYNRHTFSDISAEVAKDFGRRRLAKLSYARGVSPGNGVQLTSLQESVTGGFSSSVFHRNRLDIGGGRSRLNSAGQSIGSYTSSFVTLGISHQYSRGIAQTLQAYYRTFDITDSPVNHPQFSLSLGFSWSPGENPIHF